MTDLDRAARRCLRHVIQQYRDADEITKNTGAGRPIRELANELKQIMSVALVRSGLDPSNLPADEELADE